MFGIAIYVFIIMGLFLIVGSLWDYKIYNKRIWGHYRKKKGIIGGISGFKYRFDILRDYWDGLLGITLCLVGLYGIVNDIHETDDIDLSDISHNIFDKDNKENEVTNK